jgi:hypothetical protein
MIMAFRISRPEQAGNYFQRLEMRWDFPIVRGGPTHQELKKTLEELHGIEHIDLQRYSCFIHYAAHVIDMDDLAFDVAHSLEHNRKLLEEYNKTDARKEYGAAERVEVNIAILM